MPARNYTGEFRIDDNGDGTGTVKWALWFDTPEEAGDGAVDTVNGFLAAGTDALKRRYGEAGPSGTPVR